MPVLSFPIQYNTRVSSPYNKGTIRNKIHSNWDAEVKLFTLNMIIYVEIIVKSI